MKQLLIPALFMALVAAAPASAPSASPVSATSCSGTIDSIELTQHASYNATFVDNAAIAADEIRVVIPYGRKRSMTFDVHGAFAPGAPVTEHLHKNLPGGLFTAATTDDRCEVRYVHFVDGTSWSVPG